MSRKNLFSPYTIENIHPGFSVDCVVLSFHKKKLKVLLNQFDISDYWQLPGGFMFKNESADDAVARILASRTGLTGLYQQQFHLFSDPGRTIIDQNIDIIKKNVDTEESAKDAEKWFLQRFVSLGYYSLVRYENVKPQSMKEDKTAWFDVKDLPPLYSDHEAIIKKSLETIQIILPIVPVGKELLPEKFTMSELRKIYEIFLEKTLDRRNFQRKVLASNIVVQLNETKSSRYNPAILYSFNKDLKDVLDYSHFFN